MTTTRQTEEPDSTYPNDELLTMQEVAAVVRVPLATLRYWRHLGTGPRGFRVGRSVRYGRTDVHAWLHQQSNRPQVPH
ncbi:MAG: helix-turn-helix transcriptional regulator [Nocardioidaceae bacterium]